MVYTLDRGYFNAKCDTILTATAPPEVIASWPAPNYVDPETRGPGLVVASILLASLGIVMVAARLYSRFLITKAAGFDDALIVLALAFAIALSVLVIIGNKVWLSGYHIWDVPIDRYVGHRLNVWISQWMYVSALSCVKISVLLFYRRLSVTFSRGFMIAVWVGICYNVSYWIGFSIALLLACQPVSGYWNRFDPEWVESHDLHCNSEQIALPTAGALSVLGDFYSAALPMLLIMSLDLPRRQKWSLYALFAIGFLVVGAGIARTVLVNIVINLNYDFTWVLWEMWIWGEVELYVALLAASAPALKPFLRRFLVEPMTSSGGGTGRKKGYGDRYGDRLEMDSKGYVKDPYDQDPERIGVAYGGSDTMKSTEDSFIREVDDGDLETKHFELRQSRDSKKMVPTQIWKKARDSMTHRETNHPVPQIDAGYQQYQEQQRQQSIRNFSSPHSYKNSGDTTTSLLSHKHVASQMPTEQRLSDPHTLGQSHAMHRLSEGSVKAGRLRAQQLQPKIPSSYGSSTGSGTSSTVPRNGHQPPPVYQSQQQYMSHRRKLSAQRDRDPRQRDLEPQHFLNAASPPRVETEPEGRTSRLDPPSDASDSGNSFDEPHNRPEMYVIEKASGDHSRSTSEDTLHLPRMGSREDIAAEARRDRDAEDRRRRELEMYRRREEGRMRENERRDVDAFRKREWRKEGTVRR